ncbi:hypothetical protein SAMN05192561_102257 [Halopenitus malekzadehii]|uniref:Uncharacterized protein n=1 Tax=Halopenitus malekzadehii TaxID=1267564 RepID=A0A1H6IEG8_9EURY|nr:hypothetical protein [Halopenitus malekzadehii]SEH47246.1 hypothetical protein SAMN05192561_102257 [Halopenitus malekzadehii]
MNLQIDGSKVLYALGVLFALGAFAYFVRDVVFGLSITVKAVLLFLAFLAFLLVGLWIDRDALDVVAYAIASLAYVVWVAYLVSRYDLAETGVFLLLAVSAGLFVALGYVVRQEPDVVSTRTVRYGLVGVLAVAVLFVGADVATAGVTADATLDGEATLTVPPDATEAEPDAIVPATGQVGTMTVHNDGPFTRPVDLPSLQGCVVGVDESDGVLATDRGAGVRYEPRSYQRSDRLAGGGERTHAITAELPVRANATRSGSVTITVERAEGCDVSRSEPTLLVVVGGDATGSTPPVAVD